MHGAPFFLCLRAPAGRFPRLPRLAGYSSSLLPDTRLPAHTNQATRQVEDMGLLTVGKPHNWERAGEHREYVRRHGVLQFLAAYLRVKDIHNDELLWGDEV